MASMLIRVMVLVSMLSAGAACSANDENVDPPNSIVVPNSGMLFSEFRSKARSIARIGEHHRIILRCGDIQVPIAIPVLDGDASTPWYPFVVNRISKEEQQREELRYESNGRFFYLVCPGELSGKIENEDLRKRIKATLTAPGQEALTPCVVLVCHPNQAMTPIVEALGRIQALVNDRIVFIDAPTEPEVRREIDE